MRTFGGDPAPYAAGQPRAAWRRVPRGFIRVDADEMTYPAHVILRFRLEQALIGGDLRWPTCPAPGTTGFAGSARHRAARRRARLPAGHPLVRWRLRLFPELHAGRDGRRATDGAARRDVPDLDAALAAATSAPLVRLAAREVHGQGNRLGFNDLLEPATGKPLDPRISRPT